MPLVIPAYSALLMAKLSAQSYEGSSFAGPMMAPFCLAVATGVVMTVMTLQGQVTAPLLVGPSVGVGIICDGNAIADKIKQKAIQLFGQEGPVLQQFCQAIGQATQMHFMMATLISDTNGPVKFAKFSSATSLMKSNIIAAGAVFMGEKWPDFAEAIATGICQSVGSNGQGVVAGAVLPGTGSGIVFIT